MGIDIYTNWKGQKEEEEKAQVTGFSVTSGNVGYLREAYHGGPYVTRFLVKEAFEDAENHEDGEVPIPASVLRERLPGAVFLSVYRDWIVYGENPRVGEVDLSDAKIEKGKELESPEFQEALAKAFGEIKAVKEGGGGDEIVAAMTEEQVEATKKLIESGKLDGVQKAFVDFVELAEQKEKETGEPVRVYASW